MYLPIRTIAAVAAFAVIGLSAPAFAEEVKYMATLSGAEETPATESTGTGTADVTYDTDTKLLTWTVTYDGLSGDVVAAHFHGPAGVGEKADPVVPLAEPYASPISGSATLTDAQAADLGAGKWYVNLHTAKNPGGEIRGQVTEAAADATTMSSSAAM